MDAILQSYGTDHLQSVQCRAMFFQTIDEATSIWIKGREFTIGRMLGDYYRDKAPEYEGGSLAIFRLAPQDYHRYHSVRQTTSASATSLPC